jgi:hypothetical protein
MQRLLGSILAPGTIRSRHRFVPEEIYFAVSKIRGFPSLRYGFEGECAEVFRQCRRAWSTSESRMVRRSA